MAVESGQGPGGEVLADLDAPTMNAILGDIDAPVLGKTRADVFGRSRVSFGGEAREEGAFPDADEEELAADAARALEDDGWFYGGDDADGEEGEGGDEDEGEGGGDALPIEALTASIRATGTLTSVKTRDERLAQKAYVAAHRKVFDLRTQLLRASIEVSDAELSRAQAAERARELRAQVEADTAALRQAEEAGARVPTRDAQARLRAQLSESETALAAMDALVAAEAERAERAQAEHDATGLALVRAEAAEAPLAAKAAPIAARDHAVAALRAEAERTDAQRQEAARLTRAAEEEAAALRKAVADQAFVERSAELVSAARQRLAAAQTAIAEKQAELAEREAAEQHRRAAAVIALKRSQERIHAQIAAANTRAAAKKAAEDDAMARERASILAAGGNPHEVRRRRAEEARLAAERAATAARLTEHAHRLGARILREEAAYQAQRRKALKAKAQEREYLQDFSKATRERRADEFMRSHTLDGSTILDPTSRKAQLFPSEHAAVKTRAFGTGRLAAGAGAAAGAAAGVGDGAADDDRVLRREMAKHPGVSFDPRFVPKEGGLPAPGGAGATAGAPSGQQQRPPPSDGLPPAPALRSTLAAAREAALQGAIVDEMVGPETPGLWDTMALPAVAAAGGGMAGGGALVGAAGGTSGAARAARRSSGVAAAADGEEADGGGRLLAKPRPLSKLEQQYLAAARERQKTAMLKPQIINGVPFVGTAFLPAPSRLEFVDFEVGKTYTQLLTLTNISRTFNTFRVLALPDAIVDFFTLEYKKPGYLSAGTSATLTVTFTPRLDEDIAAELPLLCETGPEAVPIVCTRRRTALTVLTPHLDFGDVTLGETKTLRVEVRNDGVLPVEGTVEASAEIAELSIEADGDSEGGGGRGSARPPFGYDSLPDELRGVIAELAPEMVVADRPVFSCGSRLSVPGYSTVTLAVTYRPLRATASAQTLTLRFGGVEGAPDETVELRGRGALAPVYAVRELVDLKTLLIGGVYRDEIVVANRSSAAFKVQVHLPRALAECADASPAVAFVQAHDTARIGLRIAPTDDLLARCGASADAESGAVALPVTLSVAQQTLPALFLLRFQLTPATVELDPPRLDFGHCAVGESVGRTVRITNRSTLKLDFGCGPLPPELDVQPGDGLGSLLPFETVERVVTFSPRTAAPFKHTLRLSTTHNRAFVLPCAGEGTEAALVLSGTTVRFGATPFGGRSAAALEARSALRYGAHFELRAPEGSAFRASPAVLWLEPGEATRVQILFEPQAPQPAEAEGAPAAADAPAAEEDGAAAAGGGGAADGRGGSAPLLGADLAAAAGAAAGGIVARRGAALAAARRPSLAASSIAALAEVGGSALALADEAVSHAALLSIFVQTPAAAAASLASVGAAAVNGRRRSAGATAALGFAPGGEGGKGAPQHAAHLTQYVRCEGAALPAVVVFEESGGVSAEVHFGTVSVGQAVSRRVRVLNLTAETVALTMAVPDPTGAFAVTNAIRPLPPLGELELTLQFAPTQEAESFERLVIGCARGDLSLTLHGSGAAPTLAIRLPAEQPLPCAPGTLHFGACLVGDVATVTFSLVNETDFDLPCELVPLPPAGGGGGASGGGGGAHVLTERGTIALEVSPRTAVVRARSEQTVTATFAPDLPGQHYVQLFELRVPNERDRKTVQLRGHAYASAAWVLAPSVLAAELGGAGASALGDGDGDGGHVASGGVSPPQLLLGLDGARASRPLDERNARRVELTLAPEAAATGGGGGDEAAAARGGRAEVGGSAQLLIGHAPARSLALPALEKADKGSALVEFSVGALAPDAAALGFAVDVSKGTVEAGKAVPVLFSFAPTSASLAASNLGIIAAFGVAQWSETSVTLSLKGGNPPPQHPEITVVLRGFIPTAKSLAEAEAAAAVAAAEAGLSAGAAPASKGKALGKPPKK